MLHLDSIDGGSRVSEERLTIWATINICSEKIIRDKKGSINRDGNAPPIDVLMLR